MGMRRNLSAVEAEVRQPKPTRACHLPHLMGVLVQSYNEAPRRPVNALFPRGCSRSHISSERNGPKMTCHGKE